jgi:hypothetical protein
VVNTTTVSDEVVVVTPFISDADQNALLSEWRVLAPSPGNGSAPFTYSGAITAVATDGSTSTPPVGVPLGQLLSITSTLTGGLQLQAAGGGSTTSQAFVRNDSTNVKLLTVLWFVDGSLVLTEGNLNQGATATLGLTRTLLFYLRTMPAPSARRASQGALIIETDPVPYAIPPQTNAVTVTWSRAGAAGKDVLTFTPPSA